MLMTSHNQKSLRLMELIISIAIFAIVGLIAIRYYQGTRQGQHMNDTLSLLSGFIAAETQWSLQNKNKYSDNIKNLTENSYLTHDNTVNPWTGEQVAYSQVNSGASFKITLYKVKTESVCNDLANSINDNIAGGNAFCETTTLNFIYS